MTARFPVRAAALAAALLLAGALAACSDAPTAPVATAKSGEPALNTYPAPALSVSNSGGYPLISWSALAGATSYTVELVTTEMETNRQTAESQSWTYYETRGTTTGTSFLDGYTYTGDSMCSFTNYPIVTRITYRYRVTATFAGGTSSSLVAAPISNC
jgi:hypothetical protein